MAAVTTPMVPVSGGVELRYTLSNPSSADTSVAMEYSSAPGTAFRVATAAAGGDGVTALSTLPGGAPHVFMWDSLADLGHADAPAVRLRVTPAGGAPVATAPFTVQNNHPPVVSNVQVLVLKGSVQVDYLLADEEADPSALEVLFSADGGPFRSATPAAGGDGLSALPAAALGTTHRFNWNSAVDLGGARASIVLQLTPSGTRAGLPVKTAAFMTTGDGSPWVVVATPAQPLTGNKDLTYTFFAPEAVTGELAVEYSTNGGHSFATATPGTGSEPTLGLTTSAQGVAHHFVWNTVADLGRWRRSGVVLRFWPSAQGRAGVPVLVSGLQVNNNHTPSVTVAAMPDMVSNSVMVEMTLSDDESDPTQVKLEYSIDGGVFLPATSSDGDLLAGQRYQAAPGGIVQHTYWDSVLDLGTADVGNVRLRVTPSDSAIDVAAGPAVVTNAFTVIGPPRVNPTSGFMHGVVLDDKTDQPLKDVQVTIDSVLGTLVTGADGKFSFPTPGAGRFAIFASTSGYVDAKRIAWVDASGDQAIVPLRMVKVDAKVNPIVASQGGVATNAAGTIRVTIPPGALKQDIPLTVTQIAGNDQMTVDPPDGKFLLGAAQLGPCHVEFTKPVTIEFKNAWGLPPGTQLAANFLQHDRDNHHVPALTDSYDFTYAEVTPDGQWVSAQAMHFSCLGVVPLMGKDDNANPPNLFYKDPTRTTPNNRPGVSSCTGSELCFKDGSLGITESLPAIMAGGAPRTVDFTYRSTLASPRAMVGTNTVGSLVPSQLSRMAVSVAGKFQQLYLQSLNDSLFSSGYIWDGRNGRGEVVPTGSYPYSVTHESAFPLTKVIGYRARSHGEPVALNPPPVQYAWYSSITGGRVGVINERNSRFGAGWVLEGMASLHQNVGGGLFLQQGSAGTALVNRAFPQTAPTFFSGPLARGLAVDGSGTVYAGYQAQVLTKTPSGMVLLATLPSTVLSLAGVASGGVVAGLANGDVVQVSAAGALTTLATAVAATGVSAVAVAPGSGDIYVAGNGRVYQLRTAGPYDLQADFPSVTGMAVSSTGEIYVSYSSKIAIVRVGGEVRPFAEVPGGNPSGQMAMDAQGILYLTVSGVPPAAVWAITPAGRVSAFSTKLTWVETNGVAAHPSQRVIFVSAQDSQDSVDAIHTTNSDALFEPEDGASSGLQVIRAPDGTATLRTQDGAETRFDGVGRMTSVTWRGGTTSYSYDSTSKLTRVTDEYGRRTELTYDGRGNLSTVTDPASRTTMFTVNSVGDLVAIDWPDATRSSFQYDVEHRLIRKVDPAGFPTEYAYDRTGMLSLVTKPGADVQVLEPSDKAGAVNYNAAGYGVTPGFPLPAVKGQPGATLTRGPVVKRKETNAAGQVSAKLDSAGNRTEFERDARGVVTKTTLADGTVEEVTSDARGRPTATRVLGPAGVVSTSAATYNAEGKPLTATDGTGHTVSFAYDGGLLTSTASDGFVTNRLGYDSQGRVISTTTPSGASFTFSRDGYGNEVRSQSADGRITAFTLDATGQQTSVVDAIGRTTNYTRDASGRISSIVDNAGRRVSFTYDGRGRPLSVTSPAGRTTTTEYNIDGIVTRRVDAAGQVWRQRVGPGGLVSEQAGPDGNSVSFVYDGDGRIIRRVTSDGGYAECQYDSVGFLSVVKTSEATAEKIYTNGQLSRERTQFADGGVEAVAFTYDLGGSLLGTSDSFGATTYGRDGGFYASVSTSGVAGSANLSVDSDPRSGLAAAFRVGGLSEALTYNVHGEVVTQQARFGATTLIGSQLTRDVAGRITKQVETIGGVSTTIDYTYDSVGQLTSTSKNGVVADTLTYDPDGNRLSYASDAGVAVATYNIQDRLLTHGGQSFTYTSDGYLRTRTDSTGVTTYEYDSSGNLRAVAMPTGTQVAYVVDGLARRLAKKVNGVVVQRFVYTGGRPVAVVDGAGQLISRFAYLPGVSTPALMFRGGVAYRIVTDHHGSVRLVVNTTTGAVAQRLDFDAWGRVVQDTSPGFQPFGYSGGLYDVDTGLVRFGLRDYDPTVGRWTALDPAGFWGGQANLYAYVGNDPINFTDPLGMMGRGEMVMTALAFAGSASTLLSGAGVMSGNQGAATNGVTGMIGAGGAMASGTATGAIAGAIGMASAIISTATGMAGTNENLPPGFQAAQAWVDAGTAIAGMGGELAGASGAAFGAAWIAPVVASAGAGVAVGDFIYKKYGDTEGFQDFAKMIFDHIPGLRVPTCQ